MATNKKKRLGRVPLLVKQPELIGAIAKYLSNGHYIRTACTAVGINEDSYYTWMERGEAALAKRRRGEELDEADERYAEFAETIAHASVTAEVQALSVQRAAWHEDARHVEWFLERRFPRRWGRFDRSEATVIDNRDNALADAVLTDDEVRSRVNDLIRSVSGIAPGDDDLE